MRYGELATLERTEPFRRLGWLRPRPVGGCDARGSARRLDDLVYLAECGIEQEVLLPRPCPEQREHVARPKDAPDLMERPLAVEVMKGVPDDDGVH